MRDLRRSPERESDLDPFAAGAALAFGLDHAYRVFAHFQRQPFARLTANFNHNEVQPSAGMPFNGVQSVQNQFSRT
ncbi:MAG: hypothetical protein ACRD9R_11390 [Pyrinomonadaceae bacterium]